MRSLKVAVWQRVSAFWPPVPQILISQPAAITSWTGWLHESADLGCTARPTAGIMQSLCHEYYIITLFNPMHFWKMRHGDFFLSFLQLRYEIRPQVTIIAPVIIKLVCLCSRWPDCRSQASAGCLLQPSLCRVSYSLVKTEVKAPRAHPSNSCWLSFSEKKSLPSSVSVPLPDLLGQLVTLTEW